MISAMLLISQNEEKWLEITSKPILPEGGLPLSLESMGMNLREIIDSSRV
jgi:hypothetical protein